MQTMKSSYFQRSFFSARLLFFCISIANILLFFALCIFKKQYLLQWLSMGNHSVSLCDYFMNVQFAAYRENIYGISVNSQFPPFAYMLYYYIMRITSNGRFPDISMSLEELKMQPYQLMIFMMFLAVGIFLLVRAVDEVRASKAEQNLLIFAIAFSSPVFAGAIERGNIVLHVACLLILALYWKDSETGWKREVALWLIAISAGLKIYPAFMGLLYIKEKRWKEAFRLVLYGLFIFFVPFAFFGGIPTILEYARKLIGLMNQSYSGRFQFIRGVLSCLGIEGKAAMICSILFISVLILGVLRSRNEIRRMTYLASLMALVPGNAFRYTLMFFMFPLCKLFEKRDCGGEDYVSAALLGMIFTIPTIFGMVTGFQFKYNAYSLVELRLYFAAWGFLFWAFFCDAKDALMCFSNFLREKANIYELH